MSDTNSLAAGVQPSCSLAEGEGASVSSPGCCTTPRPDCMGMLIPSIGNSCAALQDTSMGTVPGTTSGAGALAPAPEVLTIDRYEVRVHLKRANHVGRALAHFEKCKARCRSAKEGGTWDHHYEAVELLRRRWYELVSSVQESGGLLHLGRGY